MNVFCARKTDDSKFTIHLRFRKPSKHERGGLGGKAEQRKRAAVLPYTKSVNFGTLS